MPLILHIETSGTNCSVCLAENGQLIDFREDKQGNSHARVLTVFIDDLLKKNNLSFAVIEAIAVSAGPGSYTGLRIGTSVAKGLCYVLKKPLIAVPTLLALAGAIQKASQNPLAYYMPVVDARRMDAYTAVVDSKGAEVFKTARVTLNKQLEEIVTAFGEVYVGGNAINKCREVFVSDKIHFIDGIDCDSRWMIDIAARKFDNSAFEDLAYFQPAYINEYSVKTKT